MTARPAVHQHERMRHRQTHRFPLLADSTPLARHLGLALVIWLMTLLVAACGPGQNPVQCDLGQTSCSGECVDLDSNANHCGACGNACGAGQVCDGAGSCSESCPGGTTPCNGECVDLGSSADHCGACGNACGPSETCMAGTCGDDSCTEASSQAESGVLPADIIVVVDNSGSMTDEAGFVQDSMNDFANTIINSGVDTHVVLISDDSNDQQGVCVPAPLGSGSCPNDENLPNFRHVVTNVASSNSLQLLLSTYPQWQDSLRPNATKTIAVISDDNSALSAQAFTDMIVTMDPTFEGFKFDAIISPYDLDGIVCFPCQISGNCASCDPCCGLDSALGLLCTALPADEGTVYKELVQTTGGIEGNLCTQDFLPVFQDMATAVIDDSQVSCLYDIPDPGNGMSIDFNRVNVEYQLNPGSNPVLIPNVPGGELDCGPSGGWYYDDIIAPTQVLLCPDTCDTVQANPQAAITVKFGCATVIE